MYFYGFMIKIFLFLDEVEKFNVYYVIIMDLCKLVVELVKVKVEFGFDDLVFRFFILEFLDDFEFEVIFEFLVKKVKKEKVENFEKNDNFDDLLGDVYVIKVEKLRLIC